jgi:surface antigen
MRTHLKSLLSVALGAFAALSAAAVLAQGMWSLGRSLSDLTAADREAMTRARTEVLEKMQTGATSSWSDDATGHSGEVALRRSYEKSGMSCGDVEYVLKAPEMKRYNATFCRAGDGTWKAVF